MAELRGGGRPPTPDSESHEMSSFSGDGSVLSPPRTNSQLQEPPIMNGASPDELTGITLSKPGYDTVPSLDELRGMAESEPSQPTSDLIVDDFTVRREGFGKVTFLGKTNVHGLDLDEIGTVSVAVVIVV